MKSRQRVSDHGEVFTPAWLVTDMLNLVGAESHRIDSRFLEPACGSGNFLIPVLERKLSAVQARYGGSEFERRHYALFGLMCVYGVELLADNAAECRARLLTTLVRFLKVKDGDIWWRAAERVLALNVVEGDALSMTTSESRPLIFPEWGYLGRGKYQRRDFRYDALTQRSAVQGTLWEQFEEHEVFVPVASFPPMSVEEIAA